LSADTGFPHFERARVLVAGDLMLDRYLWGDVNRISPEAPVPVFQVKAQSEVRGGAGNVVLDNCLKCGILWLDYDEVSRIVQTPERVQDFVPWLDITSIRTQSEDENE